MKNLILIRHAKSSWKFLINDKERPLTAQGVQNAHLVAESATSIIPKSFLVWCSTAKRTRATATIFAQHLHFLEENIHFNDNLYTFDADELENIIKECENTSDSLILFGHNDAITNFVNKFGDKYIENVPTSGLVNLVFDVNDWKEIKKGIIAHQIFPKQLENESPKQIPIHR